MAKQKIFREYDGENFVDPADAPQKVRQAIPGKEEELQNYNNSFSLSNLGSYDQNYVNSITTEVPSRFAGGVAQKPNWIDGTSTPGQATINRKGPIVPLPGAVLLQEDESSVDTKRPLGSGSSRPVIDRTTGRVRSEPDDEELRRGAILLR